MAAKYLIKRDICRYLQVAGFRMRGATNGEGMKSLRSRTALVLALVVLMHFGAHSARAQDDSVQNEKNTNGFFPSKTSWFNDGAATTVFSKEPAKTDSPDVGFYKEREEKEQEELPPAQQPQMLNAKNAKPPFDTRTASPEQIRAFYGDPGEEPALTPEDNAPTPFKAMGAALDSGNDELAFQYAKQYVRYIAGTTKRVTTIDQLTDLAFEREGIRPAQNKNNPYQRLLNKDLEAAEEGDDDSLAVEASGGRDSKLSALIRKAAESEGVDLTKGRSSVPVDPRGEVQVLFFFNPSDAQAAQIAQHVEKARMRFQRDLNVKVTGYAVAPTSQPNLAAFSKGVGISFPLLQRGVSVATALGVKHVPSVLLLAPNAQKTYEIDSVTNAESIISAISQMKGEQHDA